METEELEEKSEIERLAREVNRLKKQVAALQKKHRGLTTAVALIAGVVVSRFFTG